MCAWVHVSIGLCSHCQAWNMLWGEHQICAGDYDDTKKKPLPVEVCPSTIENTFAVGRKQWEISPDYN